jgi:hypothetical protein
LLVLFLYLELKLPFAHRADQDVHKLFLHSWIIPQCLLRMW